MLYSRQIKAFLHQRLTELTNGDTLSLQHQVQAVAPFVLQQYTSDAIHSMLSDISSAISLLTNRKTRDLIMILNSKRCYGIVFLYLLICVFFWCRLYHMHFTLIRILFHFLSRTLYACIFHWFYVCLISWFKSLKSFFMWQQFEDIMCCRSKLCVAIRPKNVISWI